MTAPVALAEGYATEVADGGSGEPLVLLHGTPLDRRCWEGCRASLGVHLRLIAYDLRGHGSAAGTPLPDSYELLADDVAVLLDRLRLERAHVLGHSFGGQVAQELALRHPGRVRSLTVVCSRATPYAPFAAAADAVADGGLAEVGRGAMARWFTAEALERDGAAVRYAHDCLRDAVPASFATALRMISRYDAAHRLSGLAMPSRWLAADRDPVGTPAEMRAAAELAGGTFSAIGGMGHMLPLEAPARLVSALAF